jgi:hypothetical protein
MIDRETLLRCLDFAVRLNDDGDPEKAVEVANYFVKWTEEQLVSARSGAIKRLEGLG